MRRAAVSGTSNIVEGCSRATEVEYLRFLDIAYSSVRELEYQGLLAFRLGFMDKDSFAAFHEACDHTARTLNALIRSLRSRQSAE